VRDEKFVYIILDSKSVGKRPIGIPIYNWKDTIKIDLTEMWYGDVD
jgi:hypothetical protein